MKANQRSEGLWQGRWWILAATWLAGCQGSLNAQDKTPGETQDTEINPSTSSNDPFAPCTVLDKCCSSAEIKCQGDADHGSMVCGCSKLWDCSKNPKKCEQSKQVPPGGGTWTCAWSEKEYKCVGNPTTPPSSTDGWQCTTSGGSTTCTQTSPNPSNNPQGGSVWSCVVDNEQNKLNCDREASTIPPTTPPTTPPTPKTEDNCADGLDNDGDGSVDCKDPDCPPCTPACPPGQECCDGIDNNGDGRIDEGNVCGNVGTNEPCPVGAVQSCDCYCGVHRKCNADGTWGPCIVDGDSTCAVAQVTSQSQCGADEYCDFGRCEKNYYGELGNQCLHHSDCQVGFICDMGECIIDPYRPCP
jgi:hypothetical protein